MRSGGHRSRSSTKTTSRPSLPTQLRTIASKKVLNSSRTETRSLNGDVFISCVRSTLTLFLISCTYGWTTKYHASIPLRKVPAPAAAVPAGDCPDWYESRKFESDRYNGTATSAIRPNSSNALLGTSFDFICHPSSPKWNKSRLYH